ncbi:hypothetical protein [Tessaracoccus sp. G1721]
MTAQLTHAFNSFMSIDTTPPGKAREEDATGGDGGALPPQQPEPSQPAGEAPHIRVALGRDLVALGFVIVLASLSLALLFLPTATEVAAAIAPVTTMVGTLIGTVFGVQAANQAQSAKATASEDSRGRAAATALREGDLTPEERQQVIRGLGKAGDSTGNGNPSIEFF